MKRDGEGPRRWRAEEELARAWAAGEFRSPLRTTWGQEVTVAFPGRPGTDRGPDFRDAVLERAGREPLRGDVEVHLEARGWMEHGHAADPAYNGVVLHLVGRARGAVSSRRQDGTLVPILEAPPPELTNPSVLPTALRKTDSATIVSAGLRAFQDRAVLFEGEMAVWGAEETLYQRLLRGLGYVQNTAPFLAVAQGVPLGVLRGLAGGLPQGDADLLIAALLTGASGFLPSQRGMAPPDAYARCLEAAWRRWGGGAALAGQRWVTFRIRPDNHPLRRLGAAAALVRRFLGEDAVESAVRVLLEGPPAPAGMRLRRWLEVGAEGYWAGHRDFGVERKGAPSALLGAERAGEMTASVVLPFLAAYGTWTGREDVSERARKAFMSLTGPGGSGVLRWAAGQTLGPDAPVRTAVVQQGLLTLARKAGDPFVQKRIPRP